MIPPGPHRARELPPPEMLAQETMLKLTRVTERAPAVRLLPMKSMEMSAGIHCMAVP